MSKITSEKGSDLHHQILNFCSHLAGAAEVTAVILLDNNPSSAHREKSTLEVVAVIRDFQPRLLSYIKSIGGKTLILFTVDHWVFDRDVDRGFLGEALASILIFPYTALKGKEYLHTQEIILKKRLILELSANLAAGFPELSYIMYIKPQYFMYEAMLNRVRVFPPLAYGMPNLMCSKINRRETEAVLRGYNEALDQLAREEKIIRSDGYVLIPEKMVKESQNPKVRFVNISKSAPRTLFTTLFGLFPQLLNFFSQNTDARLNFQRLTQKKENNMTRHFIDPQKYVYVPTSEGLVSLADKLSITAFAQKILVNGENAAVKFERVGGVLNDVYLIRARSNGAEKKALVKRFKEWSGFKWFPLTLWAAGARAFSVLGSTRLEKECAISERLRREGFNVPKILHVNHSERLVFMEYIEGENLSSAIKRIAAADGKEETMNDLRQITRVGETMAQVHSRNVALGDTKPENVITSANGEIYLLDFEQASHGGDKAWDVAEFLYYSGHYLPPLSSNSKAEAIAKAFVSGYLSAGGDIDTVRKAGTPKYTRVFSVFTLPSVVLAMSNVCKKAEKVNVKTW
ncbi:MAG: hypothetical protein NWE94_08965 [Candidatus Bathyarchaeota archaeon]|nr:hypothetical protein [Candidatus Bathyarchaeota archaeon]